MREHAWSATRRSAAVACVLGAALLVVGEARAEGAQESLAAARALFDSGDLETALVFYEKAAQQDPNNAVAHAGVGKTRFQLGDAAGAIVAYQNAVRLAPNVPALQQALRQALVVAARNAPAPAPAATWGTPSPVAAPPAPAARPSAPALPPAEQYRQQGVKHYEGRRFLFAVKAFEKSLALDPANPETHARLGDSYVALHRTRDAVAEYRKALQGAPYNVEINLAFAHAMAADGDVEGARRAYQGVLEIAPGEARAKQALAELKTHAARVPAAPSPAAAGKP